MSVSDLDLVLKAQDGDRAAFRQLLERHYGAIHRLAYRFLGNRAEAEDAAQEIAITLARKIGDFRGSSRLSTWLYQVTVNHCRDRRRRQGREVKMQVAYLSFAEARAADWADSDRRVRWLYQALNALDPALKETALLVLAEGLNHAEAGAVLGLKEKTVSWRMHEVRKHLTSMARTSYDRPA